MNIAVIGAGAAGMMAACAAAEEKAQVTVFEGGHRPGIKLRITGKGRCNLTNAGDIKTLVENTVNGGRFMYSAYTAFSPEDVMSFFESLGTPMKTERGNRVYPASDNAHDIADALARRMKALGVTLRHERVKDISVQDAAATGVTLYGGKTEPFDRIILATGGISYPKTGSDGWGHNVAKRLGHTVTPLHPSLVALTCSDAYPGELEGLSLKNIAIKIENDQRGIYSDFGEMLFTDKGVSGPVILSASAHIRGQFPCKLVIDFKPALSYDMLDKRLLRDFEQAQNCNISTIIRSLLPASMVLPMLRYCGVDPEHRVNSVTRKMREAICRGLKSYTLEITGTEGFDRAVVTQGGVDLKQIDPKTMESKLIKGLFFAGEIMDVDAYTGGFNLQIAWSTGHAAGTAAGKASPIRT